ncbi:hypothetical protein GQ42DRAFT_63149 [Ramicandelaber brevisporus]|nr:hypothetical protein GQ42DRAFT_63149 [Ramicandelaber brevisporus]
MFVRVCAVLCAHARNQYTVFNKKNMTPRPSLLSPSHFFLPYSYSSQRHPELHNSLIEPCGCFSYCKGKLLSARLHLSIIHLPSPPKKRDYFSRTSFASATAPTRVHTLTHSHTRIHSHSASLTK